MSRIDKYKHSVDAYTFNVAKRYEKVVQDVGYYEGIMPKPKAKVQELLDEAGLSERKGETR